MNLMRKIIAQLAFASLLTISSLSAQTVTTATGLVNALIAANGSPTTATTINLAAGTYTLTTDLPSLAANNLTLKGPATGAPAILDASSLASGVIFNVTADQVVIANLSLRNARSHAITIQPGAEAGRIEECAFTYLTPPIPATAAIDGNNCKNWTVTGNNISGISGASAEPAIHFYGGASDTIISNNLILNCDRAIGLGGDPTPIAPTITNQPLGLTVTVGQTASFSVGVAGTPPPTFQWFKNGNPIANATSASYTTPATSLTDSGTLFSVVVSDALGHSVTSANATLTISATSLPGQHYVDPVNGTDSGDGSSAKPWKSLQDVIARQTETHTWEAPLPYASGKNLVPVNAGAPVKPGDTIWLRSGNYGALTIQSAYNAKPITIAAEAGNVPRFSNVLVQSSQNWILRGFTVSASYAATYSTNTMVTVENNNWRGPAYDIVIDGFEIFSVPDETVWTLASDWDTKAANGISTTGARVTVRNCLIRNVDFALSMSGVDSRVEHNTIDGFSGDGLRGLGDGEVFEYNLVKNRRNVNSNHPDGFQSWSVGSDGAVGTGVVKNITLRGNVFIAYERPDIPFVGSIQGIGCFDGLFEGWVVENNVVITDHWHGISLYGARNCKIVNNTVVDINPATAEKPWIMVPAHKNGEPSKDCVIRNNLVARLNVAADSTNNIVVDHNLVLPTNTASYFVNLAQFNVRLAAGSPAIDQGNATQAPAIDADEKPRPKGTAIDVGAYEYAY